MNFFQHSFQCMRTEVGFKLYSNASKVSVSNAMENAANKFFQVSARFTRFSPDSELSLLNSSAGEKAKVSSELFSLVSDAIALAKFSDGRFDPTVIDLLEAHGYKSSFNPKEIKIRQAKLKDVNSYVRKRPSWKQIELDEQENTVKLHKKQRLDLGSLGKGYAIDLAAEELAKISDNFLISAGGDNYGRGNNISNDAPWSIELVSKTSAKAREVGKIGCVNIDSRGQAVASSGSWARSVGKFHHLIDPTSGRPAAKNLQTFVIHSSAKWADALATVLFVSNPQFIDDLEQKYGAQSIAIDLNFKLYASDDFPLLNC
jgi:thiamine biosynthesis lipoprotein